MIFYTLQSLIQKKIDNKLNSEILKIYQIHLANNKTTKTLKMNNCDIIKYTREKKNNTFFNINHVIDIIFNQIEKYFFIRFEKINEKFNNFTVYNVYNILDENEKLGRLFMDVNFSTDKKIVNPIAIRLADKMQINTYCITLS
jgi:Zn-dependent oligopeptidase